MTGPYLVPTTVPSIKGSKSRCTPSRRHITAGALGAGTDLVDLIKKDNAVIFDAFNGVLDDLIIINQLVAFFGQQDVIAVTHLHLARFGALAKGLAEHVVEIDHADLCAWHAGHIKAWHAASAGIGHLNFDFLVVELAAAQLFAK